MHWSNLLRFFIVYHEVNNPDYKAIISQSLNYSSTMRKFTRNFIVFLICVLITTSNLQAQSVLNPADPVIEYNPAAPPSIPAWGQIHKWVKKSMLWWNTDAWKAYIYNGTPFRLKFPKTYNPTAADGKKYPIMVFFHGLGEADTVLYHNELHLMLGHHFFEQQVNNGVFDGYILSIQSPGSFGMPEFQKIMDIIDYMVVNNKVDPFRVSSNGLSAGGQGAWELMTNFHTRVAAALPMSWTSIMYTDPAIMNNVKYSAIWNFHGSLDGNPAPFTVYQVRDAYRAAGGDLKHTEYAFADHGTWDLAWQEPAFFSYITKAHNANPFTKKADFFPGETINTVLALAPGFQAYQWRKDGVVIPTATTNTFTATAAGVYDARVQRNGVWSDWSIVPVQIRVRTFTPVPAKIEAENWYHMQTVNNENTADAGGGQNVGWIDWSDWMDYNINPSTTGTYTFRVRISTPDTGARLQLRKMDGTVITTVNLPQTGGWQNWQTVTANAALTAGNQVIRVYAEGKGRFNFNWMEFSLGGTPINQLPTANAGTDKEVTLPASSVQLTGSGTDPDGNISAYAWSQVSGPSTANIATANAATTNVSGLVQGSYTFRLTVTDNSNATATDDVVVTVLAPGDPNTIRIQAENWTSMSGVQTETANDLGGGLNVGYIDNGDWMEYTINPAATGTYTMKFRLASQNAGAQFQVRRSNGTVIATVNVPHTGGWQTWETTSQDVSLNAGTQTIRLVSMNATNWNINWLEITPASTTPPPPPPVTSRVEAEDYAQMFGIQTESTADAGGGLNVGWIDQNDWMDYHINIANAGNYTVSFRLASPNNDGRFQLRASDGTVLASINVPNTGGWQNWRTVPVVVNLPAGQQTVRIFNTHASGFNINWMDFVEGGTIVVGTRIEAEAYTTMSGIQTETSWDAGGGLNVGYIDNGDWMEYTINPATSGTYSLHFRVAAQNAGGRFEVRRANGQVITTVDVPQTNSYQAWQTVHKVVTLSAGPQTIRLVSTAATNWNINWIELYQGTVAPVGRRMDPITQAAGGTGMETIALYPNPARGNATLDLSNSYSGAVRVEVMNMSGAVQKSFNLSKAEGRALLQLPVGSLPKGTYILRIRMQDQVVTQKLVRL